MRKGFTLIEITLYFGLLSIFLLVLTYIFTSSLAVKLASESASALTQDAGYILSRLSYDLTNADSVTVPSSQSLQFTNSGVSYSYSVADGNLSLTEDSNSARLNGIDTRITSINFTQVGNSSGVATVQVIFTIEPVAVGNSVQKPETF